MAFLTFNELLPIKKRVRKIQTGSEVLLAYELNKYARLMLDKQLILSDVSIAKELQTREHFSFVVTNGLNVGFEPDLSTLADYSKSARYYFTRTIEGVKFKKYDEDEVVYDFEFDHRANAFMRNDYSSAAYVSMVAYIIVKSYKESIEKGTEFKVPKLIIDHELYNQQELEYVDLFILMNHGNRILDGLVEVRYSMAWGFQPDWEAYVISRRQVGLMAEEYTTTQKARYLRRNFEVGDVVLLYSRTKGAKGRNINKLETCYPAVIRYFDDKVVKLDYYPIVQTTLTRYTTLDRIASEFELEGKQSIYTQEDYDRFIEVKETYPLTSIGIGDCTWIETEFFIKPIESDGTYQWLRTPDGITEEVWLPTPDTIYAVFEDRGVQYNKEKFLETYFYSKGKTPIYDQYMQGITLSDQS